MGPERTEQQRRLAEAKASFLRATDLLSEEEVNRMLAPGSPSASQLRAAGQLFSLPHDGEQYPAFQIANGAPVPGLKDLIHVFRGESAWGLALWLTGPSGWLSGARPLDLLKESPAAVVEAARNTMRPLDV